jgi:hypothetical protein
MNLNNFNYPKDIPDKAERMLTSLRKLQSIPKTMKLVLAGDYIPLGLIHRVPSVKPEVFLVSETDNCIDFCGKLAAILIDRGASAYSINLGDGSITLILSDNQAAMLGLQLRTLILRPFSGSLHKLVRSFDLDISGWAIDDESNLSIHPDSLVAYNTKKVGFNRDTISHLSSINLESYRDLRYYTIKPHRVQSNQDILLT